jgi:hypothetical protein
MLLAAGATVLSSTGVKTKGGNASPDVSGFLVGAFGGEICAAFAFTVEAFGGDVVGGLARSAAF